MSISLTKDQWIELVNSRLENYKTQRNELVENIARGTADRYANGMINNDSVEKRMAVILAQIEVCELFLRDLA